MTPDAPDRHYSTRLRTAIVLTGSGTAGAYHAGVLRALHEAGVKIDLVAGRGIGAIGAIFAAVDGGSRLWEPNGLWRSSSARTFYRWRLPLRIAGWSLIVAAGVFAIPLGLLAMAVLIGVAGLLLTLVGLDAAAGTIRAAFSGWLEALFTPTALPTSIPRLVLFVLLIGAAGLVAGVVTSTIRLRRRRRTRPALMWRLLGSPLTSSVVVERTLAELWNLIRGAVAIAAPRTDDLASRYVELLSDNLGQPGFRELLITVHDMDAHRDVVFALLGPAHRSRFFGRTTGPENALRSLETFDLSGASRNHAFDALAAGLALPVATEPHLATFSPEGPWRGETHRLCDRPASLRRLLSEAAAAGVEQVILVGAVSPAAHPHELSTGRADLRGRAGEHLGSFEAADFDDAIDQFGGRFRGLFAIRPPHNPLGPLDFAGVYDERSDRLQSMSELLDRGYEDAYRQFIEPVVGAGGERIVVQPENGRDGKRVEL
jgi:hypothetical protein